MKTRDRIVKVSLDLFNAEGETHVTSVDLANVLDISPGNLYYHFKGKDAIIQELYDQFEVEIRQVLQAPILKPLELEDNWFYFYVVLEEIYDFRFFYRNITDLLTRYPALNTRFSRLLALKKNTALALLLSLSEQEVIKIDPRTASVLSEQIAMTLTYCLNFEYIQNPKAPAPLLIHKTVYQIMSLILPHFGADQNNMRDVISAFYTEMAGPLTVDV